MIGGALANSDLEAGDIAAVGITNQRETTVVWDRETGEPVYNAIVWQDTRTDAIVRELGDADQLREATGLPLSTYFSGPKIKWILDNVDGARERAENGELAFGTMDTWVLWNLTGGEHVTDVTNASRTLLMDLETLDWHEPSLELMGIPRAMLPEIRSSLGGLRRGQGHRDRRHPDRRHPRRPAGGAVRPDVLRRAATRRTPTAPARFLLVNTGEEIVHTEKLLTTVGYKLGDGKATYVLEGSIAVTGALIQWLRDRLKIIDSAPEVRGARPDRRRQRRRLLRARVQRPVRAVLARRRPRRDRRPDRPTRTAATSRAPRSRPPPGRRARSSTRPTRSPTCRSPSCASTAA